MEWSTVPYNAPQGPVSNGKQRTSSLEAPIMLLSGHQSAIYTMKFNPAGTVIASGSHDREIFLWRVHGDCKNFMVLKGHKNAILDLHWTGDGSQIVSASPDKTVRAWDVETGKDSLNLVCLLTLPLLSHEFRRTPDPLKLNLFVLLSCFRRILKPVFFCQIVVLWKSSQHR